MEGEVNMNEKTVYVTLFKLFTVRYGDVVIKNDQIKSEKLMRLFAYLLFHHQRIIPSSELIDAIWALEEVDNPIGALKNLVYRLRTVLKKTMGIDDMVVTGKGAYCINSDYKVDVDVHHFEEYNLLLNDYPESIEYYQKCLDLYQGRFLPELDDDYRILSQSAYYHSVYVSRVIEYTHLLEKDEKYEEMENISRFALGIDKLDENFNEILIKSLYYQKQYKQAIDTYKSTMDLLYKTLGTRPSAQMQKLFELIKKESHEEGTNISEIQNDLAEDDDCGAYLCEYGTFKDLYNMETRIIERLGICAHMCLVTINDNARFETDKEKNKQYIEKTMQKVQAALVNGLRIGDVVSRFSANQFVVLLPSCNFENAQMAMNRVLRKIRYALNNKSLMIELSIEEVLSSK